MKIYRIFLAGAAATLALASCSKVKNEHTLSEYDESKTPVASLTYIEEGSSDTKAVFEIDAIAAAKAGATSYTIFLATSMDDDVLGNAAFYKNITVDETTDSIFRYTLSTTTTDQAKKVSLVKGDLYIPMIRANYPPFVHSSWTKVYADGSDRLVYEVGYGMRAVTFEAPLAMTAKSTDESITASWRRVPYASSYTIEYKKTSASEWEVVPGISATLNSYTIEGLADYTDYDVRVKAVGDKGETDYAAIAYKTQKTNKFKTKEQLVEFFESRAAAAEAGTVFTLLNDIDMDGSSVPSVATFAATFDGQGHAIKNFKITAPVFGEVTGTIKDITFEGSAVEATASNIAVVAEKNSGTFEKVVNKTNVNVVIPAGTTVANPVAGIVVRSTGNMIECENDGNITMSCESSIIAPVIAGVVAFQTGEKATFKSNVNKGEIKLTYAANSNGVLEGTCGNVKPFTVTGGVVGLDEFTVMEECVNEGKVFASCPDDSKMGARQYIGGVVGQVLKTDINKCVNKGAVTADFGKTTSTTKGKQIWIGGIAGGRNSDYDEKTYGGDGANFNDCDNYGEITLDCCDAQNHYIGGITGQATIEKPNKTNIPGDPGAGETYTGRTFVGCNNYGKIVKKGVGQARLGGMSAGAATLTSCNNYGEIVVEDCNASSAIGGLVGYPTQAAHPINNSGNYGNITTYSTKAHTIGGIFGQHGNTSVVHGTVNVDCTITASSAQAVGFIFAAHSGYKATSSVATAGAPCKVSGKLVIDGVTTVLTSENLNQYIVALMGQKNCPVVDNVATINTGSLTIYAVCE